MFRITDRACRHESEWFSYHLDMKEGVNRCHFQMSRMVPVDRAPLCGELLQQIHVGCIQDTAPVTRRDRASRVMQEASIIRK